MLNQIDMFRKHGLGDFRTLLVELSKDPAMIFWLDNQTNTNDVHNENYGRELLELFSLGIGNYSEDDVKNCARAFTGWTLKNPIPGCAAVRALRLGVRVPARPARLTARRRSSARPATSTAPTSSTSSCGSQPRAQFVAGACTTSSSRTCRTRPRSTSWPRSFIGVAVRHPRGHADAVPVGLLPLREGVLRPGQEPGRARRRDHAAGRKTSPTRAGASASWRWSRGTWARIC